MRRILSVALLALGGTFVMSGVAGADVGDIRELAFDQDLFGDAESVEVTGQIRCQATIEYGLWVGVAQDGTSAPDDAFFNDNNSSDTANDNPTEGVGAWGPSLNQPAGISHHNPCSQSLRSWDVVVVQNRDSADYQDGEVEVAVIAGSSAEDGNRGPGPFIADIMGLDDSVDFERTR